MPLNTEDASITHPCVKAVERFSAPFFSCSSNHSFALSRNNKIFFFSESAGNEAMRLLDGGFYLKSHPVVHSDESCFSSNLLLKSKEERKNEKSGIFIQLFLFLILSILLAKALFKAYKFSFKDSCFVSYKIQEILFETRFVNCF